MSSALGMAGLAAGASVWATVVAVADAAPAAQGGGSSARCLTTMSTAAARPTKVMAPATHGPSEPFFAGAGGGVGCAAAGSAACAAIRAALCRTESGIAGTLFRDALATDRLSFAMSSSPAPESSSFVASKLARAMSARLTGGRSSSPKPSSPSCAGSGGASSASLVLSPSQPMASTTASADSSQASESRSGAGQSRSRASAASGSRVSSSMTLIPCPTFPLHSHARPGARAASCELHAPATPRCPRGSPARRRPRRGTFHRR